ncbi:MAG: acetylornithine deacetylase [Rhodospirillales bacterium]
MTAPRYSATEMLAHLIGFDTTSRDSNLHLISFVEDYLAAHGIASARIPNEEGDKANLLASVGPEVAGGVILSGHSDVVPVDGQPWSSDPFSLTERDGRLYGRGTCDMKSFLAIGLALLPEMLARPLKVPLHFAISYDEEVGCTGVLPMVQRIAKSLPRPRACLVGEPTEMGLVVAHKSINSFGVKIRGREAHSSMPQLGANSIHAAGLLVAKLVEMVKEREANPIPDSGFIPPWTTIHVGRIEGGTAQNILPLDCSFSWEYRLHPGDDGQAIYDTFERYAREEVEPWLRRHAPEATIEIVTNAEAPALEPDPESAAEALVRHLSGLNTSKVVSFATEAGHFQSIGVPTVVCGPGSIEQAHKPDEFISLSQLEAGEAFMRRLIRWAQEDAA